MFNWFSLQVKSLQWSEHTEHPVFALQKHGSYSQKSNGSRPTENVNNWFTSRTDKTDEAEAPLCGRFYIEKIIS